MRVKVQIGYKFIIGFIVIVSVSTVAPHVVKMIDVVEWLREPLSFLIAVVIGLTLGSFWTRSLTRDFSELTQIAHDISGGDLTRTEGIGKNGKILEDESTELALALNMMLKNLKGLVNHIKDASTNITEAALMLNTLVKKGHETTENISNGTAKIFDGALEQSSYVENATKVVQEMAKISDDVSVRVANMAAVASQAKTVVQRSALSSNSALKKMESLLQGVDYTKEMTVSLEEKINNIPRILDVISYISRQTDLLALNATIEASKAGEHGRGFAIVAEEVRRFADNTKHSVEDVTLIIKEIRGEVERLVNSTAESATFTQGGREDINKIRNALDEIIPFTTEVAEKAEFVLTLTAKQKEGADTAVRLTEQIANIAKESVSVTGDVDNVVDEHKSSMKELIISAKKLSELSGALDKIVARFKLQRGNVAILSKDESEKHALAGKGVV